MEQGRAPVSFISINWRGRPLRTYETIINWWRTRRAVAGSSFALDSIAGRAGSGKRMLDMD
jgi:hypothetical protein